MEIILNTPEDFERCFLEADVAHQAGDLQKALSLYHALLQFFPEVSLIHYNTAHAYHASGQIDRAIDHYQLAQKFCDKGDEEDILFNLACAYKDANYFEKALHTYSRLLDQFPRNIDALFNMANIFKDTDQPEKAITTYLEVLSLQPEHLPSTNNLAFLYHSTGQKESALKYYQRVVTADPANKAAAYMVSTLNGEVLQSAPLEYVETVFNNYSEKYEESLVEKLEYDVPRKLFKMLHEQINNPSKFKWCLDLGCGSGLAGDCFARDGLHITGVDLSEKMLEIAEKKAVYATLVKNDINSFLSQGSRRYDLLIAADVFTYMGELDTFFSLVSERVMADTVLLFSTELCEVDFTLRPSGRFAHSVDYISSLAETFDWNVMVQQTTHLRKERGEWVQGELYILEKN